jgi:hypothetical protein
VTDADSTSFVSQRLEASPLLVATVRALAASVSGPTTRARALQRDSTRTGRRPPTDRDAIAGRLRASRLDRLESRHERHDYRCTVTPASLVRHRELPVKFKGLCERLYPDLLAA